MVITDSAIIACNVWWQWILRDSFFPECRRFGFFLWDGPILSDFNQNEFSFVPTFQFTFVEKSFSTYLMTHLISRWFTSIFSLCYLGSYFEKKNHRFYAFKEVFLWVWKGWLGSQWINSGKGLPLCMLLLHPVLE